MPPRRATRSRRGLAEWIFGAGARPALAAAAVLVVAGASWWWTARPREYATVRGAAPAQAAATVWPPRAAGDVVEFRWSPTAGADAYRLALVGPALEIVFTRDTGAETTLVVPRAALPAALAPGAEVQIEVTALAHGAAIAVARSGVLSLP